MFNRNDFVSIPTKALLNNSWYKTWLRFFFPNFTNGRLSLHSFIVLQEYEPIYLANYQMKQFNSKEPLGHRGIMRHQICDPVKFLKTGWVLKTDVFDVSMTIFFAASVKRSYEGDVEEMQCS